jgi:hypothetical protein
MRRNLKAIARGGQPVALSDQLTAATAAPPAAAGVDSMDIDRAYNCLQLESSNYFLIRLVSGPN